MTSILIADDHTAVRLAMRALLEAQPNWKVVAEAQDGKEAIEKALSTNPDIAILDYSMPFLNGIEVTKIIRARMPHVQVLIFSMLDTDRLVREALEGGAHGFLPKSDAPQLLVATLKALVSAN
jgi:DNA-binding NarL/FixJ family response regulator